MPVMTTLTAAQITALPTLPPYRMGQPRAVTHQAREIVDGYHLVITPTPAGWTVDLYAAATTELRASHPGLSLWPLVELTMWEIVAVDQHRQAGVCIWEADSLWPCLVPALPGRDCCAEHDHAFVMRTYTYGAYSVTCRCGRAFVAATAEEAFGLHALHGIAEVPRLAVAEHAGL
ncbi:MAG: hypothetical protein JWO67_4026 [Streptosporangiaceae bacterium]|nr:hypothetical protein [Streptosporangiaceae bacterium]